MRKKSTTTKRLIWLPTGGHMGDAIMVAALFAELLRADPSITITYLVRRNANLITDLVQAYPKVAVVPITRSTLQAARAIFPLFAHRAMVIAPPAWGPRPLVLQVLCFLFLLRGDSVIAFEDSSRWRPYTERITHDRHRRYIDNLRAAAAKALLPTEPVGMPPRLKILSSRVPDFPFSPKRYIVVHPFPHMATSKTLPLRRWKLLLQELLQRYPTYGIVITGTEVDRASAQELAAGATEQTFLVINLALSQLAGVIEKAALYIGVDTGPTHIAGVLGVPSVVLAQQNEPAWLPSYNQNTLLVWEKKNCRCGTGQPCVAWEDSKSYRRCVYDLSDETILAAIETKLPRDISNQTPMQHLVSI